MIYLIWGLLNIGLYLYFLAICFKAAKLIREKIGLFDAVFFVFGLLSFNGNTKQDDKADVNQTRNWTFVSEDSLVQNEMNVLFVVLEKKLLSEYTLGIKYGKDQHEGFATPASAWSSTIGIVMGTDWKPGFIFINKTNDKNKLEYFVNGIEEWYLLGMKVYVRAKEYKGITVAR